jgi:hypothetical protein
MVLHGLSQDIFFFIYLSVESPVRRILVEFAVLGINSAVSKNKALPILENIDYQFR